MSGEWVWSRRPSVEPKRAIASTGWSDKLNRAVALSGFEILQDETSGEEEVEISRDFEKMGRSGQWAASGWQLSCRVRGRPFWGGILVPVLGPTVTSSDWYCGLAERENGRARGAGKRAAGHGTEAATSDQNGLGVQPVVRALLLPPRNSLNGSQCWIDFWISGPSRGRVRCRKVLSSSQDGLDGRHKDAKGTQEIGPGETRPMGRRLQGGD